MKFKQRAFRMRLFNEEILEKIAARIRQGYDDELLKDILEFMNKWAIELEEVKSKKEMYE